MGNIRIGLAGWDYADWKGVVYPAGASRGFDRLAYVSTLVDAVEINNSFYRPVAPRVAESWLRRTERRTEFRFTAKSHRSWTHEPGADPADVVPPTLEGLRPLLDAGRLGALLIQFPQSFHFETPSIERLVRLLDPLRDWPTVVEVRHRSWESDEAGRWFERQQAGWCVVDQPAVSGSTARPVPRVVGDIAYLRLHGRNARDWFRPDAGRDARYDYLYDRDELAGLAGIARGLAAESKELFVIQNNHFRGQALVNTLQLRHLIEKRRPEAPAELVRVYPTLAQDVTVHNPTLF